MIFSLSSIDGTNGFILDGVAEQDRSGLAVGGAGDINNDGFADIVIGAYAADPNGLSAAGEAYVVFGRQGPYPARVALADLDGENGFVVHGAAGGDRTGYFVATAGDLNGDGVDDVAVGGYTASPNGVHFAGTGYVVFGGEHEFPATIELSQLTGGDGLRIHGSAPDDLLGGVINSAGDVNGDGVDDLIVGARYDDRPGAQNAGAAYVLYGRDNGFMPDIWDDDIHDAHGFAILGASLEDRTGIAVDGVGDVNLDGIDDIVIGSYLLDPLGRQDAGGAYLVFGQVGTRENLDLSAIPSGTVVALQGAAFEDYAGWSVSGVGDMNGDGIADFAIGAFRADVGRVIDAGAVYIVYGRATGWPDAIDLSALNGIDGMTIHGAAGRDKLGLSIDAAGDFNHDGYADLIIGAYAADPDGKSQAGRSYVIFGRSDQQADIELASMSPSAGIVFEGIDEKDFSGFSVAGAGDVNGDGVDDVIIGGRLADPNGTDSGESYVIFGQPGALRPASADNDILFSTDADEVLDGGSGIDTANYTRLLSGVTVDLRITSEQQTGGGGRDTLRSIENVVGSRYADVLTGNNRVNQLRGDGGNDRLNGNTSADYLSGDEGNDLVFGDAGNDVILGGAGRDRLYGSSGDDQVFGGMAADNLYGNYGDDHLYGGVGHDRLLGGGNQDFLDGGAGNDLLDGGKQEDVVRSGAGADRIIAGPDGAVDIFQFFPGDGHDRLFGFEHQTDVIQISADYGMASVSQLLDEAIVLGDTVFLWLDQTMQNSLQIIDWLPHHTIDDLAQDIVLV